MCYDFFFFFFFFGGGRGGGSHGVKGIEVTLGHYVKQEFRLLCNLLAAGNGRSLYSVQSQWGLKEFKGFREL